jgi:hypothetical protein
MFQSFNQIIFSAFFLFGTILKAEAYSTEDITTTISDYGSSTVTITTPCPAGAHSDGFGGCYYADTCEDLYGPCDCEIGRTICCAPDECTTITTTEFITTTYAYPWWWGADICEMIYGSCDCESGRTACCAPDECTATTVLPISSTNKNKCHKKLIT